MIHMNKQIYVNIAGASVCVILWFLLAMSIFMFSRALTDIRENKQTNKEILTILKNPVSCDLPYVVQDQIEQTYKNVVSFECETNQ